jgi:hypothetical protein
MSDYIQIAAVRGHCQNYKTQMSTDDFYTLCLKNPNDNIGLRKKSPRIDGEIIFKSSDVTIDYLCCDFVRFCLALLKNSQNLYNDQMSFIPKQPIPISEELRDYIEEFLPDYYGIRDNVK